MDKPDHGMHLVLVSERMLFENVSITYSMYNTKVLKYSTTLGKRDTDLGKLP
jgi:hypothetical protein